MVAGAIEQRKRRPAFGAGIGLGVKSPLCGIIELVQAPIAERESRHARIGAVVRQRAGDGEPRTALGAVDERIAVAPVARIEQLGEARLAHSRVGCDPRARIASAACSNLEACVRTHRRFARLDTVDASKSGRLARKTRQEAIQRRRLALDLDGNAVRIVAHPS